MSASDKAQSAVQALREAVIESLEEHGAMTNTEIAEKLSIESGYIGEQRNSLSWSILGLLLNNGEVEREGRKYFIPGTGSGGQTTI